FAWGELLKRVGALPPNEEYALVQPGAESLLSLRSRRGIEAESTLWIEKMDIDALLAARANGQTMTLDDEDDSTLSVCRTALYDRNRRESDPDRYVDTTRVPFVTISLRKIFRPTGVM